MSEKATYALVKKNLAREQLRLDRVENMLVEGMFDFNYCCEGVEGWIEIKHPKEPVRATTPLFGSSHKVSQSQKNWALRQRQAGGRAFFLIGTEARLLLIDAKYADQLNEMTLQNIVARSIWLAKKPIEKQHWAELRESLVQYEMGSI